MHLRSIIGFMVVQVLRHATKPKGATVGTTCLEIVCAITLNPIT